ncbi:MAG: helix-turn-helix domain-containing protein [Desulfobacter sp.]|nr:helix-turn-helix domain-containing protein [Desulfobacter sp.]WDP83836.1 MAG: helix-turn-helix domain-containing protein [Desulfobacter sp.]
MQCVICHNEFTLVKGALQLHDKILGTFTVKDTVYEQCEGCGEKLYLPKTLRDIEETEKNRKYELLMKCALEDFIKATEVAEILGCSKQAVHKHKRIRRGFIHFVRHNNQIWYHKKSVKLFLKNGDGRFPLAEIKEKQANVIKFSDLKKASDIKNENYDTAANNPFSNEKQSIKSPQETAGVKEG